MAPLCSRPWKECGNQERFDHSTSVIGILGFENIGTGRRYVLYVLRAGGRAERGLPAMPAQVALAAGSR